MERVRRDFWIPAITWNDFGLAFAKWACGVWISEVQVAVLLVGLLTTVAWRALRRDTAAMFFAVQAIVPWIMVFIVATVSGRSLLQDRYLTFAHIAICGFVGIIVARLTPWTLKLCVALLVLVPATWSGSDYLSTRSTESSPIKLIMRELRKECQPGDAILVQDAPRLNTTALSRCC
jgi:hypothetical protein